jgi:hypothetical protein
LRGELDSGFPPFPFDVLELLPSSEEPDFLPADASGFASTLVVEELDFCPADDEGFDSFLGLASAGLCCLAGADRF